MLKTIRYDFVHGGYFAHAQIWRIVKEKKKI